MWQVSGARQATVASRRPDVLADAQLASENQLFLPAPFQQEPTGLRLEVRVDERFFAELQSHWDVLWQRAKGAYFTQSCDWCRAVWETIGRPKRHALHCLVGWDGDNLGLIWPFEVYRRGVWSICRPLGSPTTEYTDVLVVDSADADQQVAAAWHKLRVSCRSDVILLPQVLVGSRLHRVLSLPAKRARCRTIATSAVTWHGYDDWQSYSVRRSRAKRRDLERLRRRLNERGNVRFAVLQDGIGFGPALEWLFRHKTASLARMNRRSVWRNSASYQDLLSLAATSRATAGRLLIFSLTLNDRIIAAAVARRDKIRVEFVVPAFDRGYAQFSPGMLLLEDSLKWAFERCLDFDLRIGADAYKEHWLNRQGAVITCQIANSPLGRAYLFAAPVWHTFNRHLYQWLYRANSRTITLCATGEISSPLRGEGGNG